MNYYNENDPKAAAWLRELISANLIAPGEVDGRSICDVKPSELSKFSQCHFFAGIGGWSLAFRLAGIPDDYPAWSGSCPCQPFSVGNAQAKGKADERHLWPDWSVLIKERNPPIIFGEQVASAIPHGWLDDIGADLEAMDYAFGSSILPACAYGAEHERKRLFWVADSGRARRKGRFGFRNGLCGIQGAAYAMSGDLATASWRLLDGDFSRLLPRDGVSVQMERDAVKGYGNAIHPPTAAQFIQAAIEAIEAAFTDPQQSLKFEGNLTPQTG
jgi:DNA (cytosine-5)-methyltransferase 1